MRNAYRPQTLESPSVEQESDGLAEAVTRSTRQHGYLTWNSLSVLAAEYAHAVLDAFHGNRLGDPAGLVQHESQRCDQLVSQSSQRVDLSCPNTGDIPAGLDRPKSSAAGSPLDSSSDLVRDEAARVRSKFAKVDASVEVVLRFDFMKENDTKVSNGVELAAITTGLRSCHIYRGFCLLGCKWSYSCCYFGGSSCAYSAIYQEDVRGDTTHQPCTYPPGHSALTALKHTVNSLSHHLLSAGLKHSTF